MTERIPGLFVEIVDDAGEAAPLFPIPAPRGHTLDGHPRCEELLDHASCRSRAIRSVLDHV